MYLVLYKKCILNKNYNEVIDCTLRYDAPNHVYFSFFSKYLETLTKKVIQIDDAFYTDEGQINIEMEFETDNLQSYNYMMLSNVDSATASMQDDTTRMYTRFCFIKNIEIRNDVAIVNYITDIWHTYSRYINVRMGYLSRSRLLSYKDMSNNTITLSPYNLPTDFDGNKNTSIISYFDAHTTNRYSIICEIQLYDPTTAGGTSDRECYMAMLNPRTPSSQTDYAFTRDEVIDYLIRLQINNSKSLSVQVDLVADKYRYELGNVYVVPYAFGIHSYVANPQPRVILLRTDKSQLNAQYDIFCDILSTTDLASLNYFQLTGNNFKYLSVGTFTKQYPLIMNGTDFKVYFKTHIDNFNFNLFLDFQNQIIDITNEFNLEIPFNSLTSEQNAQRRIARVLNNFSNTYKIVKGVLDVKSGDRDGIDDVVSGGIGLIDKNIPLYTSNKGTFANSSGLLNAYHGFVVYTLTADNQSFVEKLIEENGYKTYYVGNFAFNKIEGAYITSHSITSNFIKYDYINLYGDFAQDIRQVLEAILLKGVKIWYTENV